MFFFILIISINLNAQTEVSGDVEGVWDLAGSPYVIVGEIMIPTGSSLRIMPGCSLVFIGPFQFEVDSNASFKAIGTVDNNVIITAYYFAEHRGIRFYHSAEGCSLVYCSISGGRATGLDPADKQGGGIYCYYSHPVIHKCDIVFNQATWGGGIFCSFSNPEITFNNIEDNNALTGQGGAICCFNSSPYIYANVIAGNRSTQGGAICCSTASNPDIIYNMIRSNTAQGKGGALYIFDSDPLLKYNVIRLNQSNTHGGALYAEESIPDMVGNKIYRNLAYQQGGGICLYSSSPNLINNTVYLNGAYQGGGLYCRDSSPIIINNSFMGNPAEQGCELYASNNCLIKVFNTISWGDTLCPGNSIYLAFNEDGPCTLFYSQCDVDASRSYVEEGAGHIIWGSGNFSRNPAFADTLLHLSGSSFCVDGGTDMVITPWRDTLFAPESDYEEVDRPIGETVDVGADEYGATAIRQGDKNQPRQISLNPFPNPFNGAVTLTINETLPLSRPGFQKLTIFNLNGELVFSSILPSSSNTFVWQPESGNSSGLYIVRWQWSFETLECRVLYMK